MENISYKVCTHCFTYNHSLFIKETMNGFVMQETTFPYVICIVDDDSTDNEASIIEKYFESEFDYKDSSTAYIDETGSFRILFARHKSNQNCYFAILLLKENLYRQGKSDLKLDFISEWNDNAEYIAICEGDDYWTNSKKLQMQVDFMDANPDYSMCHTDYMMVGGMKRHYKHKNTNDVYFPESVYHELPVGTATVLYRNDVYKRLPKMWKDKNWLMGDTPLWIELSKAGKIKYLPEITASYRILSSSASHGSMQKEIDFFNNAIEIHRFYANYYNIDLPNSGYDSGYYLAIGKIAFKHKEKKLAWSNMYNATSSKCLTAKLFILFFCTIIPPLGYMLRKIFKYNP